MKMVKRLKSIFLSLVVIVASCSCLEGICLDSFNNSSNRLKFEKADSNSRDFLVNFAIESNDIYNTRTAENKIAKKVFEISDEVFEKGVVEVLKLDGVIVGFYTIKVHKPSKTWFEHELGHLFVKKGFQKKGLGTHLFKRAILKAKLRDFKKLEWLSDPDAEEFYLKMGAVITSTCENLLNPGVDLPVFEYYL
jgi:GNAT superfamily N-acetyltransferase